MMLLFKKIALFLMWTFIIAMYVFKGEDVDANFPELSATATMPAVAEESAEQERELEARYFVYNYNYKDKDKHKIKIHAFNHEHSDSEEGTHFEIWTHGDDKNKVIWTSNDADKEWSDAHGMWKINKDHNIWVSGNSDVKVLSGSADSDAKVYAISKLKGKLSKVKEIKEKHKELKLKEGNKVISIYSASPHNIKIKTLDKGGN